MGTTFVRTRVDYDKFVIEFSYYVSVAGAMLSASLATLFGCLFFAVGWLNEPIDYGVTAVFIFASLCAGYTGTRIVTLQRQQNAFQNLGKTEPRIEDVPVETERPFVPVSDSRTIKVLNLHFSVEQWRKLSGAILAANGRVTRSVFASANCIPKLTESWPSISEELQKGGLVNNRRLTNDGIEYLSQFTPLLRNLIAEDPLLTRDDDDDDRN